MTKDRPKLLIVEDDKGLQRQLRWAFEDYEVLVAGEGEKAVEIVGVEKPPVVLLDLGLPPDPDGPTAGLAALEGIIAASPDSKVVMMTGQASRAYAVQAVGAGAYDFYQKPVEIDELTLIIKRAQRLHELESQHRRLQGQDQDTTVPGIITVNDGMSQLLERVKRVAGSTATALIIGESGTGKELVAKGIHLLSDRRDHEFVAINCAAIPDQLLEGELFGHEKGAFTGAIKTTRGKVELAHRGTLFLDEIGDLSPHLQAKLLRFLQERVIERIGGREEIHLDVRVISATNRELTELIQAETFREDLYYRLSEITIEVPPLRDRLDDVVVIANHYLRDYARDHGRVVRGFTSKALSALAGHTWPGNIRELQNRVKAAVINASGSRITPAELDLEPQEETLEVEPLKTVLEREERRALRNAIAAAEGNISRAAKLLGISRPKLYDLIRHHNIKTE